MNFGCQPAMGQIGLLCRLQLHELAHIFHGYFHTHFNLYSTFFPVVYQKVWRLAENIDNNRSSWFSREQDIKALIIPILTQLLWPYSNYYSLAQLMRPQNT